LDLEHENELQDLQKSIVERFKQQKYSKLTDEIKIQKDKRLLFILKSELRALKYDPTEKRSKGQEDSEDVIQSRIRTLLTLFEEKESQLMVEDLEASMLCEVSRLNFLNFLRVFQVEMELGDGDGVDEVSSPLREDISKLHEQILVLKSGLIVKVILPQFLLPLGLRLPLQQQELSEKQSVITRYEQKEGVGLKVGTL
jgi:hypothetical protein